MHRRNTLLVCLGLGCAVAAGWVLGIQSDSWLTAYAEPGDSMVAAGPFQLKCRTFEITPGAEVDLPGSDSEAGRWVQQQSGYTIWTVDYEAVQKSTGFPQHMLQVCVTPQ